METYLTDEELYWLPVRKDDSEEFAGWRGARRRPGNRRRVVPAAGGPVSALAGGLLFAVVPPSPPRQPGFSGSPGSGIPTRSAGSCLRHRAPGLRNRRPGDTLRLRLHGGCQEMGRQYLSL
jgi:hypothetical protein